MENNQENINIRNIDNKTEEEKVSNIEIALKEKQLILENSFKKLEEELQIHKKKVQEKLKEDEAKDLQDKAIQENKLLQEKESEIARVKDLISKAREASVAGNYNAAVSYLNSASSIISHNPLLKGSSLESSIQRVSSEIVEVQNGYISANNIGNLVANGLSEKEAEEHRTLLSKDMLDYYRSTEHKEKVHEVRTYIEEGKEPPAPMLKEYVNHTLEKDEKEKSQYIDRLALMVDHLDKQEKSRGLIKEENEERKLYKEELKGARLDRAVQRGIRDLAQKETGRSDLASLRTFVNAQLETEQGQAKIREILRQSREKAEDISIQIEDKIIINKKEITGATESLENLKDKYQKINSPAKQSKDREMCIDKIKNNTEQERSSQEYLSPPSTPKGTNNTPGKGGHSK